MFYHRIKTWINFYPEIKSIADINKLKKININNTVDDKSYWPSIIKTVLC